MQKYLHESSNTWKSLCFKSSSFPAVSLQNSFIKLQSFSCKNKSVYAQMSPGVLWFRPIGEANQMQIAHSSTDQGQRELKTWESGFPQSVLWTVDLSQFKSPKKAINSTLKFSNGRRVKLWHNCHDLINKRNGCSSWPCMGDWQFKIIWINSDSTITEPSEQSVRL